MTKTILITGASTGFGRDTAETLARAGHKVFASMRDPQAKNRAHADALRGQNIEVVELDVTDSQWDLQRLLGNVNGHELAEEAGGLGCPSGRRPCVDPSTCNCPYFLCLRLGACGGVGGNHA